VQMHLVMEVIGAYFHLDESLARKLNKSIIVQLLNFLS